MRCEAKKKRKRPRSGEMRNRAEKKTLEASTEGGKGEQKCRNQWCDKMDCGAGV
jgi:hypothetical protein